MQLPGHLRKTSLGDLLGSLHRARANGTLELSEHDRTHRIFVSGGHVVAVEIDGSSMSLGEVLRSTSAVDDETLRRSVLRAIASRRLLGEVLVHDFRIAPKVVGAALRRQIARRLELLDRLQDARISFRVAMRAPATALRDEPLAPEEFLTGRSRARDREENAQSGMRPTLDTARIAALRLLGLGFEEAADADAIRRAYRKLAKSVHPDTHPHASDDERRRLEARFSEVTNAYSLLARAS
ncbi:MAG: DnaJ domain-containing protein [Polyangiaceae bacterium]